MLLFCSISRGRPGSQWEVVVHHQWVTQSLAINNDVLNAWEVGVQEDLSDSWAAEETNFGSVRLGLSVELFLSQLAQATGDQGKWREHVAVVILHKVIFMAAFPEPSMGHWWNSLHNCLPCSLFLGASNLISDSQWMICNAVHHRLLPG